MSQVTTAAETPVKTLRAGVNERQLLQTLKHVFSSSFSMVGELMQNARRAGASRILFNFDPVDRMLTVDDDGSGIADFADLVQLCESGWDEQTILTEKPFGMGVFSLLYAAREITFRSRGCKLSVKLEDVIAKRAMYVQADPDGPSDRTVIELHGLSDALVNIWRRPPAEKLGELAIYQLTSEIATRARGFPIPVFLNGVECDRPFAQANLTGELTSIGFVSIPGVHAGGAADLPDVGRQTNLFLQGLPIQDVRDYPHNGAVHLDGATFTPQMPDRARLYDESEALRRIRSSLNEVIKNHIVQQKAALDRKQFVQSYWNTCRHYGLQHLLDDIPWIPRSALSYVREVSVISDNVLNRCDWEGPLSGTDPLIARADITNGGVNIWRGAPSSTEDSAYSALILKIMQRERIVSMDDESAISEGHWLEACSPHVQDLVFDVTPAGLGGSVEAGGFACIESCTMQLVDFVDVKVTSKVDDSFVRHFRVENDWVICPADHETTRAREGDVGLAERIVCYVMRGDSSPDHPVEALSAFEDENDHFRQEWRDDAVREWDSRKAGLLGASLANVLTSAVVSHGVPMALADSHAGQLAVVRVKRYTSSVNHDGWCGLDVVDLQREGFWEEVISQIGDADTGAPLAHRLRDAFTAVVKPGEVVKT